MALLELLVPDQDLAARRAARSSTSGSPAVGSAPNCSLDQLADALVLEVADRRDDQVRRGVGVAEVLAQQRRR